MRRAIGVVVLLLVAACGSGDDEAQTTVVTAPSSTTSPSSTAASASSTAASASTTAAATVVEATSPNTTTTTVASTTTVAPVTTEPEFPSRPGITELIAWGGVLNIAHAGGDQEWPHSTFYAYDQAVAAGADVLEMDVQLTADGVLIVQHDDTVDGTTDGSGRVDSFTFDEIAELDAAHWYVPGCWPCRDRPDADYVFRDVRTGEVPPPEGADPDDFRIVAFDEMVDRYPRHPFDIEIKGTGDAARATADALAEAIVEHRLTDHVIVVSFDDPTVQYFRSIAPDVAVSPGVGDLAAWLLAGDPLEPAYRILQVPPEFDGTPVITPDFWDAVSASSVWAVWMWPNDAATQENAAFYQEMIDQGVRGIIAGRPSEVPD